MLEQSISAQAPTIFDRNWKRLPPSQLARLGSTPGFSQAAATGNVSQNVLGTPSTWTTWQFGNTWFARSGAGMQGLQGMYFIYIPARTMSGLPEESDTAFLGQPFLGQTDPTLTQTGPGTYQSSPITVTGTGSAGPALQQAGDALNSLLTSSGAPAYTSGQGPSNPTVLAFQQAWNADPLGQNAPLETDGEYGTNTMTAMQVMGYSNLPQPNVLSGGSPDNSNTPGYTGQAGGASAVSNSTFGIPNWALLGGAGIIAAGLLGNALIAHPKGKAAVRTVHGHARRAMHAAKRHAGRIHRLAHR